MNDYIKKLIKFLGLLEIYPMECGICSGTCDFSEHLPSEKHFNTLWAYVNNIGKDVDIMLGRRQLWQVWEFRQRDIVGKVFFNHLDGELLIQRLSKRDIEEGIYGCEAADSIPLLPPHPPPPPPPPPLETFTCPVHNLSPSSTPRSLGADPVDDDCRLLFHQFMWHKNVRDVYSILLNNLCKAGGLLDVKNFRCQACTFNSPLSEEHLLSQEHINNIGITWSGIYREAKKDKGCDISWLVDNCTGEYGNRVQIFECRNGCEVWFNHLSLETGVCQSSRALSSTTAYQWKTVQCYDVT